MMEGENGAAVAALVPPEKLPTAPPAALDTIHVANLSLYTTEEQVHELFTKAGRVRRVIMGLNSFKRTPCGFCFVQYDQPEGAENCLRYLRGARLDDRPIRVNLDPLGFEDGKQFSDRGRRARASFKAPPLPAPTTTDDKNSKAESEERAGNKRRRRGDDDDDDGEDVKDSDDGDRRRGTKRQALQDDDKTAEAEGEAEGEAEAGQTEAGAEGDGTDGTGFGDQEAAS
eukprot:m.7360 g.7360  ORF g.7360 m.7360 type:complete len:228 (+) comp2904_c0_seq1:69-752(+)